MLSWAAPLVEEHTFLAGSSLLPHPPCWNPQQMAHIPPAQSTQKILCRKDPVPEAVKHSETKQWAEITSLEESQLRLHLNSALPLTVPRLLWQEPWCQTPAGEQWWCTCWSCTGPPPLGWSETSSRRDRNSSLLLQARELPAQSKRNAWLSEILTHLWSLTKEKKKMYFK